jgi:hypothetical protein
MNIFRWLKKLDWAVKIAIVVILVTAYKFDLVSKFSRVFITENKKVEMENNVVLSEPLRSFSCDDFKAGKLHFEESRYVACEVLNQKSGKVCLYPWYILDALKIVRDKALNRGYEIKVVYSQTSWKDYANIFCDKNTKYGQSPYDSDRVKGCEVGVVLMQNAKHRKSVRERRIILSQLMVAEGFRRGYQSVTSWVHDHSCYYGQVRGVEWRTP